MEVRVACSGVALRQLNCRTVRTSRPNLRDLVMDGVEDTAYNTGTLMLSVFALSKSTSMLLGWPRSTQARLAGFFN